MNYATWQDYSAAHPYRVQTRADVTPSYLARPSTVTRYRVASNAERWRQHRLRPGGVYRLRGDMRRYVARPGMQDGAYDLFTTSGLVWNRAQSEYRLEPTGVITYRGAHTPWTRADLLDTGQTIPSLAAGA